MLLFAVLFVAVAHGSVFRLRNATLQGAFFFLVLQSRDSRGMMKLAESSHGALGS
jgi:hypothetical protein